MVQIPSNFLPTEKAQTFHPTFDPTKIGTNVGQIIGYVDQPSYIGHSAPFVSLYGHTSCSMMWLVQKKTSSVLSSSSSSSLIYRLFYRDELLKAFDPRSNVGPIIVPILLVPTHWSNVDVKFAGIN